MSGMWGDWVYVSVMRDVCERYVGSLCVFEDDVVLCAVCV